MGNLQYCDTMWLKYVSIMELLNIIDYGKTRTTCSEGLDKCCTAYGRMHIVNNKYSHNCNKIIKNEGRKDIPYEGKHNQITPFLSLA